MGIRVKFSRWLSEDEFREVLEFADYKGVVNGERIFEINPVKLRRANLSLRDVLAIIDSMGGVVEELPPGVGATEKIARLRVEDGLYVLRSRERLLELLAEFGGTVRYSRELKGFIVKPYVVVDVVDKLRRAGFEVVDETGLLEPKPFNESISLRYELRPYQREALEAWKANKYRGVIALPTGAGKTIVALAAIAELKVPTLIVVYTREQLKQWVEKIREALTVSPWEVGAFYGEEKRIAPITVTTYQTAWRRVDELRDKFALLIVDEAHHLPAERFRLIAEGVLAPYRMALSATPEREDGLHVELFRLMGGLIYRKSASELAAQGYLAQYRIVTKYVTLTPKEAMKYRELRRKYAELAAGRDINELIRLAASGDESASKALKILNEMRKIVINAENKLKLAKEIAEQEASKGSKVIIFTQYVEQAKKLGVLLGAPVITGKTDRVKRDLALHLFKTGRARILVVTTVGDEGLDIPDANVGIILSGTSSKRQFIQRLGRLLRPAPGKKEAILYEIVVKGTMEEAQARRRAFLIDL
ncbi:type III restriction protein res subunit [Pyrolobus fumarii 1A]|uniref:DNA 3'-5' helicase n=1 Tax=Pyrolobus fumarii (strain DSM 11204 / 1A) TaxID=694429 RepID=G0ECL5_PYRF1|nr:DEAD/DEAH box helicase [Pyrolobus fumarii]AEM39585.1 type III restriction protein res subunit [Pyrolobus fumarii 1A]